MHFLFLQINIAKAWRTLGIRTLSENLAEYGANPRVFQETLSSSHLFSRKRKELGGSAMGGMQGFADFPQILIRRFGQRREEPSPPEAHASAVTFMEE